MSAVLTTPSEARIAALVGVGYTEHEASFLCLAALHGGYFVRRQFAEFLGCRDGATVTRLAQRVLALEHARASTWCQNTQVYHLGARPFYAALGEADNRNRRQHEWTEIKNRIMGLDFVLAHRNVRYLATEREKLDYFTGTQIEPAKLPAKRYRGATEDDVAIRYFVDKYPLFVIPADQNEGAGRVGFCFVDEGMVSLSRFEHHLAHYRPLFECLPHFELVYVADTVRHFARARAMFERFRARESAGSDPGSDSIHVEPLLTYFRLRRLYEERQFDAFDRSQLIQLRDAREAFSNPKAEALYVTWKATGDTEIRDQLRPKQNAPAPIPGTFSTECLTHDYGLFGQSWPR